MSETRQVFNDKTLVCQDCGHDFVWTAGEQSYYQRKQLATPKRCPHCRKTKRQVFAQKEADPLRT
ncbi:MAG: zinc-ribbon domain containing protein [Candidatus Acidiferrales bacterium]|jgi:rubrerythrin